MPIIVNADDLGYSENRDAGIFEAFENGCVSSASLMVNGPSAATAVKRAKEIGLYLGLHLNLTEGLSLTGPSSITNQRNVMYYKDKFCALTMDKLNEISGDICEESIAQIERFKDLTGEYPLHVDGHQHVHIFPGLPDLLAPILHNYGVLSVRIPDEDVTNYDWLSPERKQRYDSRFLWCMRARLVYKTFSIRAPDCFIGLGTMGHDMNLDRTLMVLSDTFGIVEWMVHPGCDAKYSKNGGCMKKSFFNDVFDTDSGRAHELHQLKTICCRLKLIDWSCYDIFLDKNKKRGIK